MPIVSYGFGISASSGSVVVGNPQITMKVGGNMELSYNGEPTLVFETPASLSLSQSGSVVITGKAELTLEIG